MAKFVSKCDNLVLCVRPAHVQIVNGYVNPVQGEHVRFENGLYETDSRSTKGKEHDEFIRGHRLFGSQIFEDKKASSEKSAE